MDGNDGHAKGADGISSAARGDRVAARSLADVGVTIVRFANGLESVAEAELRSQERPGERLLWAMCSCVAACRSRRQDAFIEASLADTYVRVQRCVARAARRSISTSCWHGKRAGAAPFMASSTRRCVGIRGARRS